MASWVITAIYSAGYLGIVALMFIENIFPPIPSEVIMPLAGYMSAQGQLMLPMVVLAGTAGSVLGALPLYWVGKKIGTELLKKFADRHGRWLTVSREELDQAERWFTRYGSAAVLLCRLVPGIRSLISVPAGIYRMGWIKFLFYTAAGALVWTALLAYIGYLLGSKFEQVGRYLDPVSWLVLGMILIWYLTRVVRHKGGPEHRAKVKVKV